MTAVLVGATAMASLIAAMFFLKFWRRTHDTFFLLFSVAFALDSATRFIIAVGRVSSEMEPLIYLARLGTFGLIIAAIVYKNRAAGPRRG